MGNCAPADVVKHVDWNPTNNPNNDKLNVGLIELIAIVQTDCGDCGIKCFVHASKFGLNTFKADPLLRERQADDAE